MRQRVVVLEDDPDDQRFLDLAIDKAGFELDLVWCSDPVEARRAIEAEAPAMAIVDLSVPGGTGFDLLAHMRSEHPDIPAVVLTSSTAPWDHREAIRLGARAVHTKPFAWSDYQELVELMLRYWLLAGQS